MECFSISRLFSPRYIQETSLFIVILHREIKLEGFLKNSATYFQRTSKQLKNKNRIKLFFDLGKETKTLWLYDIFQLNSNIMKQKKCKEIRTHSSKLRINDFRGPMNIKPSFLRVRTQLTI